MPAATNWQSLAATHRRRQLQAIPSQWLLPDDKLASLRNTGTPREGRLLESDVVRKSGLLCEKELEITERFTATELLSKLSRQQLTAEEVIVAFSKRASLAHQLTNCLTEIFFKEAIDKAKQLDANFKTTGTLTGPLHGLPVSLKDPFIVRGQYATVGYIEFLKRPIPDTNSPLVDLLLDAGAVLYCKTNLPQTQMSADSDNNIFGRTLNPHNTHLTPGGSSGGEGALVAFRGSILGVGTDIAGSVRIPALCNGTYGFKPTANRVPDANQAFYPLPISILPGVIPVAGPLANSVDDLSLFMKTLVGQRPWRYDASALDIPWRVLDTKDEKPLVIGILPEDPTYPLHPPVRRALETATVSLQKAGHTIVQLPFDPRHSPGLGARIAWNYFALSYPNPLGIPETLGEPLVPTIARGFHPFTHGGFPVSRELDVPRQLCDLNEIRDSYSRAWHDVWRDNGLDVVLGPGAVSTAVPHDTYGVPVYTVMWNVLDYPAGIIPFGTASKDEDPQYQKATAEFDPDYDPEACDGAPCALQVIAPRFRDEECLKAMRVIDRDVRV
ncbi:hypothetical protein NW764_016273 [Fusarium oxysporum]|nr:hypothetical protein NW764_016273 [Fusarium oxysporum]